MTIDAEKLASRIGKKGDANTSTSKETSEPDAELKSGDAGRRLLAAIFGGNVPKGADPEAVEEAIIACVEGKEGY